MYSPLTTLNQTISLRETLPPSHLVRFIIDVIADSLPVECSCSGGKDTWLKAEASGIVGVTRVGQVAQGLGACPAMRDLPAEQQEARDRVKGHVSARRSPAEPTGQHGT